MTEVTAEELERVQVAENRHPAFAWELESPGRLGCYFLAADNTVRYLRRRYGNIKVAEVTTAETLG